MKNYDIISSKWLYKDVKRYCQHTLIKTKSAITASILFKDKNVGLW